jgi:mannose-6-phosphate isomerase
MCGFREPGDIGRNLERFLSPAPASLKRGMAPLAAALTGAGPAGALRAFFTALFELSAETRGELTAYIKKTGEGADPPPPGGEYMTLFAGLYPGDPALIAPLYLNTFELKPGEAVYLDAGVLHAYIRGFGVELMANSDNVLRGGLSPKHIDLPELFRVLDFSPHKPLILKAPEPAPSYYTYPAPCGEFSLSVMTGQGGETPFPETGPSIAVITRGEARVSLPGEEIPLLPGESVFIPARGLNPAGKGEVSPRFSGSFTAYVAAFPGGAPDANTMAQKAAGKGSGGR